MYSFKFYYLEACNSFNIKQNEKLLTRLEESSNTANLNISGIELTDNTCKAVGHALKKDVFLQELDLSNCMLSDDGLSNILSGLETNKFLLTLNLKGNNIRSEGTAIIGKLLRHNSHLQNLYLEWNATGIFPEKFSYLCEGLCVNTSLKSLDLRNNQLNHLCAQSLSDVIYGNSTLQYLDLRWNSIGIIGGRSILKTLSKNKSILKLDIAGNDIPLEIHKSIEFITSVNAERHLKSSEDLQKTRLFASKFQQLEGERDKQLKTLKDQLENKDKVIESTERWNTEKLNELQEMLLEREKTIDELTKKSENLQKKNNILTQEKDNITHTLKEFETKIKESRKDFSLILDKEKKEKEDTQKKFVEELGMVKEENSHLKQKIQELKINKETLDTEIINLKSTLSKVENMLKLEEKSYQDQLLKLNEVHQENLKELDKLKKNEIIAVKNEFSEIEKNLKEQITLLDNKRKDLEKKMIEKDDFITTNKVQAERTVEELKMKMKEDEDKLRKQMEERIMLLESANKKQEELIKENLEAFNEIQKKCLQNDLKLAEESRRTQQLEKMLEAKNAEMEASIAKVKLEVRDQIDKLNEDNTSLKLKIEEMRKKHREEIQNKDEDMKNLQKKMKQLKIRIKEMFQNENKELDQLQATFASYVKFVKYTRDKKIDLEDELIVNG